jgi:DNA-binding response OmpR family regulator
MPSGLHLSARTDEPSLTPRALRVLIADDEHDTVTTLSALLREEGYEVQQAYSGRDAVATIHTFDPDVAILDIAMPGMTGWDVARTVRKNNAKRPLLIAISGAYTKGADKVLAQIAGFDYYLAKPCDPNVLMALLVPLTTRLPR